MWSYESASTRGNIGALQINEVVIWTRYIHAKLVVDIDFDTLACYFEFGLITPLFGLITPTLIYIYASWDAGKHLKRLYNLSECRPYDAR